MFFFGGDKKSEAKEAQKDPPISQAAALSKKSDQKEPSNGNVLMISNQKHRSFYERAARELLASGHQELELSALGNATPLAVAVALSLQDKKAASLSKIKTKFVDFTPNENGSRQGRSTHSAGVSITLLRHPEFKGTRIVPGHVFFCVKSSNDDFMAFHESPDLSFAFVNSRPADELFKTPYGVGLAATLKKAGQEDLGSHEKLRSYLFEEALKTNQGINDLKSINFVGEIASVKSLSPNLKAAFVRISPRATKNDMTGCVFIELFENDKWPHKNENNAAVVHVIAPRGNLYSTAEDFLDAVEHTAANLMTALCDYNGYSRRSHNGSLRLRKLAVARLGLFSCEPSTIHARTNTSEVAKAVLKGLDSAYHFGTAPRLQFIDDENIIKKIWLDQSGVEEVQISENIFRRSIASQD